MSRSHHVLRYREGRDESEMNQTKRGKSVGLQVGTHNDLEVTPLGNLGCEEFGVSNGLLGRVDRAGANDDENSIIVPGQNSSAVVASGSNGLLRGGRRDDLVAKQGRLDEGVVLEENRVRCEKGWGMVVMDARQRHDDLECSPGAFQH
jgi:hypothetical protein